MYQNAVNFHHKQPRIAQFRLGFQSVMILKMALLFGLLLGLTAWSGGALAKSLTVTAERQQIEMGDIITLVIVADFQVGNTGPDLSLLKDQFEVLGTQRSHSMRYVNGNYTNETVWSVRLSPRQVGELIIPPFQLEGVASAAYPIKVLPAPSHSSATAGAHFLIAEVSTSQPYVQQEVIYTLRFFHLGRLVSGNIRPPALNNALSEPLGDQKRYQKQHQGQLYDVYEWRYVFYPQTSGTYQIEAPEFSGAISRDGRMKQINDVAQALTLEVQPKPDTYPQDAPWLPAKQLTLSQQWKLPNNFKVGDSATLNIQLQAVGLKASQLPKISYPAMSGVSWYPDAPQSEDTLLQAGIGSQLNMTLALVPTQAGNLTLPKQEIAWWNVQTQKLEYLVIPAKTLQVLPAPAQTAPVLPVPLPNDAAQTAPMDLPQAANLWLWQTFTLLFALLWLATLGLLKRQYKLANHKPKSASPAASATQTPSVASDSDKFIPPKTSENLPNNHQAWWENASLPQIIDANLTPLETYQALSYWRNHRAKIAIASADWQTALANLNAHLFKGAPFGEAQRDALKASLLQFQQAEPPKAQRKNQLDSLFPP